MLRRALHELAPERAEALLTRRPERRIAVERRQLLTTIAPADERRRFNRRELDRWRASMSTATPGERNIASRPLRKGLLLDVYV